MHKLLPGKGNLSTPVVAARAALHRSTGTAHTTGSHPRNAPPTSRPADPRARLPSRGRQAAAPRRSLRRLHPSSSKRFNTREECRTFNDPSAGSPTETLLRLLLPLSATVWSSFRQLSRVNRQANNPRTSLKHSIGSSDGRCVQRAGTYSAHADDICLQGIPRS